jgi:hypothetical protein
MDVHTKQRRTEYLASIGVQYPATLLVVVCGVQEVNGKDLDVPRHSVIPDAAAHLRWRLKAVRSGS